MLLQLQSSYSKLRWITVAFAYEDIRKDRFVRKVSACALQRGDEVPRQGHKSQFMRVPA